MLKIACSFIVFAAASQLWSQVEPSATGGPFSLDDTRMMTPPPVSNGVYPVSVGVESHVNYVTGGIVFTGAYNDNLLVGSGTQKTPDEAYSILPSIDFDRHTPHESVSLSYSAGATLYQHTSSLNGITQTGTAEFRYHLSPYAVVAVSDSFNQNYNTFNSSNPFSGGGVPAGGPSPSAVYVYPFANQLGNTVNGGVEYQYGRNAMIGAGGTYGFLHYDNTSSLSYLNDSNTGGGSAFWSRRISRGQYLGVLYEYSNIQTNPVKTTTDTHTIYGFYTKYLTRTVSLSVLGGPQHYSSTEQAAGASSSSWEPAVQGSVGVQTSRTNFSAGYTHLVTGAGGLVGAFHTDAADVSARWQFARTWNAGVSGSYSMFKNVTPIVSSLNPGGHTLGGIASLQHSFRERFRAEVGYGHFHQSYNASSGSTLYPDCNRVYGSIAFMFYRPLGR